MYERSRATGERSARFLVSPVRSAVRAELLQLDAVRVVAPVLLGDVVAVLAHLARERDLRSHVSGSHSSTFLGNTGFPTPEGGSGGLPPGGVWGFHPQCNAEQGWLALSASTPLPLA